MRLTMAVFIVALACLLAAAANAVSPPDPLKFLGKPSRAGYTQHGGYRWLCEEWDRPALGWFIRRCFFVGRVSSRPSVPGS